MDNISYKEQFVIGDHLILELVTDEIFEGDFCEAGKDRIDLVNTCQHNNPNQLEGLYSFYRSEISRIKRHKSKATEKPCEKIVISEPEQANNTIKIVEEEYNRLKEMSKQYIYLEHADKQYYDAIQKLNEAETIGLVPLGIEELRTGSIKLLAICTWQKVYLVELANIKTCTIYPELRDILESEYICKVMHKAGPLIDNLYRKYKVFTQNVFDTQVVDLIIQKNRANSLGTPKVARNVSECLEHYLNFPESILKSASSVTNKKWMERPLSDTRRLYAAQLVTYLILLKDTMQKILFKEVYCAIQNVHDYYYHLSNVDFANKIHSNDITKDIDDLIPILSQHGLKNVEVGET